MKYLGDILFGLILLVIAGVVTFLVMDSALAAEPLEMYVTIPSYSYTDAGDEVVTPSGVELVVTDQDCEKWTKKDTGMDLHYAYALNKKTQEKVEGCFGHDAQFIYIELVDEHTKNVFSYKVNADNFVSRLHI